MGTLQVKIVITVFIFAFIFISGLWLKMSGKPYNAIVLAAHKLISVGIVLVIVATVYQINKAASLNTIETTAGVSMFFICLIAIVSGAFLSTGNQLPSFIQIIHKASSAASIVFAGILLFLLKDRL
jgi:hypothetical protein